MKKILTLGFALFMTAFLYAQSPKKMSYQAILRNADYSIISNQDVTVQVSVLKGEENEDAVYQEIHHVKTGPSGLISLQIGMGKSNSGTFANIDWSKGPFFIKTETDPNGGEDYLISSTTELMSVPYAMYAEYAKNAKSAYESWLSLGHEGSEADFIEYLRSGSYEKGGNNLPPGFCDNVAACISDMDLSGLDGSDGLSAYEIWLNDGNLGSESDFLASLVGPAGADGVTGPQGPQGPAGADGADGATGPQGPAGADGADGATGPQGPQGPAGADGADGATGPQGPAGADGADGATGPQGPQGPAGANGADGATGPQGPQGPAGANGADGATGPQGPAGADGADGATGPQGLTGPMGPIGPAGPQGPSGADGLLPNGSDFGNIPHWTGSNWSVSSTALDYDGSSLALNDNQIRLRGAGDGNHVLGYLGGSFDGPLLQGFSSVVLKTVTGGDAGGLFMKNGRIGIGTTNPLNGRLHVESSYGVGFSYGYLAGNGSTGYCGNCGGEVSIWAQRRVAAEEFNAFSDARIKEVVGLSDSKSDLATLLDVKVTDYTFVDKVAKGDKVQKKVIAQELEKVYPNAVKKIKGVVPDIYKVSSMKNGTIHMKNDLKVGDRVKLIFDEKVQIVDVLSVSEKWFATELNYTGDVFVYGREVEDFRTVDYEAISMLNVSATQELHSQIKQLESQLEGMNNLVEKLSEENSELKVSVSNVETLQSKVESIMNMLNLEAEK